ncbi:MAG: DUF599 domain-containing protein, partial [Pseudomonadota bacterium]
MSAPLDWMLAVFEPLDLAALTLFLASLFATTRMVEKCPETWPSTSVLMARHRAAWMAQLPRRDLKMY